MKAMKISIKLSIIFSLQLLCMAKMSDAYLSCYPYACNISSYNRPFSFKPTIQFPFRIKDVHSKSCGSPGFEVYCDEKLGTLIELPSSQTFNVEYIFYLSKQEIELSDPSNCLPQKLISLNLTTTPFRQAISTNFSLYKCSGDHGYYNNYDHINCLSTSNYTVISVEDGEGTIVPHSNCTLMDVVSVPMSLFGSLTRLSDLTSIYLTWEYPPKCESCETPPPPPPQRWGYNNGEESNDSSWRPIAIVVIPLLIPFLVLLSCLYCRFRGRNYSIGTTVNTSRINNNANTVSQQQQTTTIVTTGLDQITIDSYPVVVLGESGRLIKSEEDMCPICLSNYVPQETLKILPHCLHRFHVECIDQWLLSKASCPVCRVSPLPT